MSLTPHMAVLESALRTTGPIFMRLEGCLSRGVVAGEAMVDNRRESANGSRRVQNSGICLAVRCETAGWVNIFGISGGGAHARGSTKIDEKGVEIGSKVTASCQRWPGRGSGRARRG